MTLPTPDVAEPDGGTVDALAKIADTRDRAVRASKAVKDAQAAREHYRDYRDAAMLALVNAGEKQIAVVRRARVARTVLSRLLNPGPKRALPNLPTGVDLWEFLDAAADKVHAFNDDIEPRLRAVRDDAIIALLFEEHMENHDVAELTGESSVRVSQLRTEAVPG